MMFLSHIAFSLELIVLACGACLVSCAFTKEERCVNWVKKLGVLIIVFSILGMVCTSYYTMKYWLQGAFESPSGMSMAMHKDMMQKMMPLMMEKMKEQMGNMSSTEKGTGNMSNMEHLQNMGSQQSMEHMQTKEGGKSESTSQ